MAEFLPHYVCQIIAKNFQQKDRQFSAWYLLAASLKFFTFLRADSPPGGYLGKVLLDMCSWHLRTPTQLWSSSVIFCGRL